MKIPKNYTRVYSGIVKELDYIKWKNGGGVELADGLIGSEISSDRSFTVYRKKRILLDSDKKIAALKKENTVLKAELAAVKAKWAKVSDKVGELLEVL